MKKLLVLAVMVVACLLIGAATAQAQLRNLDDPDRSWNERIVIGLPEDDESDDEGDDEGSDCPPYPAPVAATGQFVSYGPGDDGEYQMGVSVDPRFTDNGDGTVTDNLTGLVWLKDAGCLVPDFPAHLFPPWLGALSKANDLENGSCGLTDDSVVGDWRLPSLNEYLSLMNWGHSAPALPPNHLFTGFPPNFLCYWSSTTYTPNPASAWSVCFSSGLFVPWNKDTYLNRIWAVRGGQ